MTEEQTITDNDKLLAAITYIFWPLAIIILVSETNRERPFQRYHAVQSLGLNVVIAVMCAFFVCFSCLISAIVGAIVEMLGSMIFCLSAFFLLIPIAILVWCAYRAYQGEKFELPVLTEFMQGQGWL